MDELLKYFPLVKVDEANHMVWGIVTSETPDSDKEICDYDFAKGDIKRWSDEALAKTTASGQDTSLGNMRVMHQLQIGGKAIKIEYRDDVKQIWVGSEPADETVWHLLKGGFLTMHSIGGGYAWKRKEGEYVRFGPRVNEISYVDAGANPDATFAYVKADGTTELRKFAKPGPLEIEVLRKMKETSLSEADVDRIAKALGDSLDSRLDTQLAKLRAELTDSVQKHTADTGANMKPEDLKKCAAALGITEAEFTKQYLDAPALAKAKGLAALHGHLETMHGHHEAMHKAHAALGAMHEKMGSHIEKCMKACKSVMGDDEKDAEKAIKALLDEMRPAAETEEQKTAREAAEKAAKAASGSETFTKAEVESLLKKATEALEKKIGELPVNTGIRVVPRDEAFTKAVKERQAQGSPDPMAV